MDNVVEPATVPGVDGGNGREIVSRPFNVSPVDENALFMRYFDNPNLSEISRDSGVPYKTVLRLSIQGKWEERRDKIAIKAKQKIDYTLEQATSQSLLMVRAAKNKLASRLQDLNPKHIATKDLIGDIERMIKLEQLLLGGMTDRKESVALTHEDRIKELREARIKSAKDITPHQFVAIDDRARPAIPENLASPEMQDTSSINVETEKA